jgi:hypothetical protein
MFTDTRQGGTFLICLILQMLDGSRTDKTTPYRGVCSSDVQSSRKVISRDLIAGKFAPGC